MTPVKRKGGSKKRSKRSGRLGRTGVGAPGRDWPRDGIVLEDNREGRKVIASEMYGRRE